MLPYPTLFQVHFNSSQNEYQCMKVWLWEDPNDPGKKTYRVLRVKVTGNHVIIACMTAVQDF